MWPFKTKKVEVIQEEKTEVETWTPVIGYEKYYVQNEKGQIKSLGKEFDSNIENGVSEEKAAWLTMNFLKGYYGKNSQNAYNIEKVIEVMDKKWNLTKKHE
jgi:predicted DNA-binding ArsR family transcriptional regulator